MATPDGSCPLTGRTEAEPTCMALPPVVVSVSPPPPGAAIGAGALTGAGVGSGDGAALTTGTGVGAGAGADVFVVVVLEEPVDDEAEPLLVTTVTGVDMVVLAVGVVVDPEVTSNASTQTHDPAELGFFVPAASIASVWEPVLSPDTEYTIAWALTL